MLGIVILINKKIVEWSLENIQGKCFFDEIRYQEKSKMQVVSVENLEEIYGFENTHMSFVRTKKLLNKLSKEKRELLEKELLSINDIFADERFIKAYFDGTHEDVMFVI